MGGGRDELYAHTPSDVRDWHLLLDHLRSVAELAASFGEKFGAKDLAYLSGLWHDVGKAHPGFQQYLEDAHAGRSSESEPHAIWGAALAANFKRVRGPWREVALPVAGHHAGLNIPSLVLQDAQAAAKNAPDAFDRIRSLAASLPGPGTVASLDNRELDRELRIRMILSVLVDADRLDTEAHIEPASAQRRGFQTNLGDLWQRFETDQQDLMDGAEETEVNAVRKQVYQACLAAASSDQGIFRLTVPTGGGKTRSGLAFALRHAIEHDLDRVIVAIPYTSIIDQTAEVYRDILGDDVVLEHHSRIELSDDERQDDTAIRLRLATENWDAPVVVTTTVQFFESLFSHHPSRVRKIHRIANSVVLLDEVQTLPVHLLEPSMEMLASLARDYGTTIVLSTATQPALEGTPYVCAFEEQGVNEIVPEYTRHFEQLQRVDYNWREQPTGWPDLARELEEQKQALAILNTRGDALAVLDELPRHQAVIHLSTLLCPKHRRDQLKEVRRRLDTGKEILLVSTQVVEAGVDIDFPVVYRALGPLDRIVQAAGRCNREGALEEKGEVVVFYPAEGGAPPGAYRSGLGWARENLDTEGPERLHDPDVYQSYFKRLFQDQDLDSKGIQDLRRGMDYRKVSRAYRLIDQDTVAVVVDYKDGYDLAREYVDHPTTRKVRELQHYTVNLYRHEIERHARDGWVTQLAEGLYRWDGKYDDRRGIQPGLHDPADLIKG